MRGWGIMKKVTKSLGVILVYLISAGAAHATEHREHVCAKYVSTGKAYQVDAIVASGTDLNNATHTFNYDAFETYAVIFWAQGQASVIKLEFSFGNISPFGSDGTDQEGHRWNVSTSSLCF
jgi:hypothetical protein